MNGQFYSFVQNNPVVVKCFHRGKKLNTATGVKYYWKQYEEFCTRFCCIYIISWNILTTLI